MTKNIDHQVEVVAITQVADAVKRFRGWLGRNGRRFLETGALVVGGLLILRGTIELIVR